ncbi:putative monovalent cation/H+ antiporter subunit A [Pontibacter beigongshangensis]|uniref:putative monovalent cation/H+ antiporter subunit A n=1 Tax=Pontibacter beigongshangensis TaxID=2574733 RepID=UPI0016507B79|nr:putative monovalent cation/H+ antiporter subunit A [Pontibacter beigongshangensis]
MLIVILAGVLLAFLAPLLYRWLGRYVSIPMALYPLSAFVFLASYLPQVLSGETINVVYRWAPALNINLHFYIDGLSLFFALLVTGFGTLIMIYAGGYLKGDPLLGRFYLYLTLFMVAMAGVVLSGNIFCLFVFWELTSLSSYLLIGYKHNKQESRDAALQALMVTGAGGMALMAGLLLLGMAGETYTLSDLLHKRELVTSHDLYLPLLVLILIGAFTKSAQFPFHFWLPNAMAAPTPVSAYLHSATMVKAGIYLLARLTPVLGGTEVWHYSLMTAGGITTLLGALLAIQHTDLKAILAYTTISALGILVTMTGIGSAPALQAMLVFLLAHALYKGTLFLVAGNVDHATGTREIGQLQGLGKGMKTTAVAAMLAAMSMAGVLPFFGFIGKELLYEAALGATAFKAVLFAVSFFSGMVFAAVALVLGYQLFWRRKARPTPLRHSLSPALFWPPLILASTGLVFGLFPAPLVTPVLRRAAEAMLGVEQLFELALWHGFTLVLGLSLLTLLMGYVVYRYSKRLLSYSSRFNILYKLGPDRVYGLAIKGLLLGSTSLTRIIQNGYLRVYITVMIITLIGLLVLVKNQSQLELDLSQSTVTIMDVRLYEVVLFILILPALLFLIRVRSRLTSIAILGMIGYSGALYFVLFGAPDVAATQLLIETMTVVVFVLVLHKLPQFRFVGSRFQRIRYMIVSVLFGAMMTYVTLLVKQYPLVSGLKTFYGENSYLLGHGRNIVNVILVDFRALDTLGETTVLGVAAIGIYAMLKLRMDKDH